MTETTTCPFGSSVAPRAETEPASDPKTFASSITALAPLASRRTQNRVLAPPGETRAGENSFAAPNRGVEALEK